MRSRQSLFTALLSSASFLLSFQDAFAIPAGLAHCDKNEDCTIITSPLVCDGSPVPVSVQWAPDVEYQLGSSGRWGGCPAIRPRWDAVRHSASPASLDGEGKTTHTAICREHLCALDDDSPAASSTTAAGAACPEPPAVAPSGDAALDKTLAQLRVPLGAIRRRAIISLTVSADRARAAVPLLAFLWHDSETKAPRRSFPGATNECFIGDPDVREEILSLLRLVAPDGPIPNYVLESSRAGRFEQDAPLKAEYLRYLERLGSNAAPAVPDLLRDIVDSRNWSRDVEKAVQVLGKIPAQRDDSIPVLVNIAKDGRSTSASAALHALYELDADSAVLTPLVDSILDERHSPMNAGAQEVIVHFPLGCSNHARCVEYATEAAMRGPGESGLAAIQALERFGPEAAPALPTLVMVFGRGQPPAFTEALSEALTKIDPTGDSIVPLLQPRIQQPGAQALYMPLLRRFTGAEAKALAERIASGNAAMPNSAAAVQLQKGE